jgi:hypothetical protein
LQIAGNAVTIPVSSQTSGSSATASINVPASTPIYISATFNRADYLQTFSLSRGGTTIYSATAFASTSIDVRGPVTITFIDFNAATGNNSYTATAGFAAQGTTLLLLATKR